LFVDMQSPEEIYLQLLKKGPGPNTLKVIIIFPNISRALIQIYIIF